MTTPARAVFAILVAATFAAFFVAQRLKHSPTVVQRFMATPYVSPNHDGRFDRERISFRIKKADDVTVAIVDHRGDEVRRLVSDRHLAAYRQIPTLKWDGRDDSGHRVPDGIYRARITLRREGRSIIVPHAFRLDTKPPRPLVIAIGPEKGLAPELLPRPGGGPATVHFRAPGHKLEVLVFKTAPGRPRLATTLPAADGATSVTWDGTVNGRPVSPGTYLVALRVRDSAGNIGTSVPLDRAGLPVLPHGLPLPGRGGITVRYVGVQPPSTPTTSGAVATFGVDTRRVPYTWSLRRVGGPPRPIRRGTGTRALLHVHAPGGASGVYLLSVRTRRHGVRVPFVVQSAHPLGGSATHPRGVLVVMPWITWQGRNPVDDDGDGAPNLLDLGVGASLDRVLAGDGLPAGFAGAEGPLLGLLDRTRRRYDITTDAALSVGQGPKLEGHRGVLLASDTRWITLGLAKRLRAFVRGGGTLVSLGTDSLRRRVQISRHGRLYGPSAQSPVDVFGARIGPVVDRRVTLTNFTDSARLQLFAGTTGQFGGFRAYEETTSVGPDAKLLSDAVTPSGHPVIVAAQVARGLVVRTGLPGFASRLTPDPEVAQLMGRLWTLLSS